MYVSLLKKKGPFWLVTKLSSLGLAELSHPSVSAEAPDSQGEKVIFFFLLCVCVGGALVRTLIHCPSLLEGHVL